MEILTGYKKMEWLWEDWLQKDWIIMEILSGYKNWKRWNDVGDINWLQKDGVIIEI